MKKLILKGFALLTLAAGVSSCGNDFLETDYYSGLDIETSLNSVSNLTTALNGTYYRLYHYQFAGNYAIAIGDVPTDLSYWNNQTNHWNDIYQFTFTDTSTYLLAIWNMGYKTADNAARIIRAAEALYADADEETKAELDAIVAEAYALRGYAQLMLVNIYGHQIKVAGADFSEQPGIVVIDRPIKALTQVERSTVGKSYEAVIGDLETSLTRFAAAGGDRGDLFYFGQAAVQGLLARTYLYMEQWDKAKEHAQKALDIAGITTLTYTAEGYKALYNTNNSNVESIFALAITPSQNWSANSFGTLWTSYNMSPSPKLQSLYAATDCRKSIMGMAKESTAAVPVYGGGKLAHFASANPANATNYIVNAPEMFLIIAEAEAQSPNGSLAAAQNALLTVAKRNSAIAAAADLPSDKAGLLSFIKDERARELFQEGHRLYDLRRWGDNASVYAYSAPEIKFSYNDYKISDLVFPIPVDEINSGFGVKQNDWSGTLPR